MAVSSHKDFMKQTKRIGIALLLVLLSLAGLVVGSEFGATPMGTGFDWRAFLAPFHTVTLHLPIGFVLMAVILEVYHILRPSVQLRRAIGVVLVFSALSAVVVVMLGIFRAEGGGYEPETLEEHRWFGIAVGGVTVIAAIVHLLIFRAAPRPILVILYRVLLAADMVLLAIAGHGGGNLTHGSKYLFENAPAWVKKWTESSKGDDVTPDGDGSGTYREIIQPIFEAKCYQCHGPEKQKGDYRMDTAEGLFTAGESELDPILKGNAVGSYLVETITVPEDHDVAMPPDGKDRLTPEETLAIIRWIWEGAKLGEE